MKIGIRGVNIQGYKMLSWINLGSKLLFPVIKLLLATVVEGDQKAPFSIATTPKCRGSATPFPGLLHLTLNTYLILLSVKQGGIKYHFKSLWYGTSKD